VTAPAGSASLRAAGQRGQVLVWFLAFAATLAVVFAGVYSVGQVTSEKQKVVNATDAAAYSGALTEARALNLASYTNRAVIANEVLVAQMVSLDSWTSYFEKATENYEKEAKALSVIPYVGVLFKALALTLKALNTVVKPLAKAMDSTTPVAISAWELLYAGWYNATIVPAFTPPVMALAAHAAAENVLAQNVARQGGRKDSAPRLMQVMPLAVRNEFQWSRLIKRYKKTGISGSASDDRKYAAELLLASRDAFSTDRSGSDTPFLKLLFGNSELCIPFVIKLGSEKQGPTRLVNFDRWEAQDTVEFKLKVSPGGVSGCTWGKGTVAIPQGWGRATADRNGSRGTRINTGSGAGNLAFSANHGNRGYTGVKELYDVERGADGKPLHEEATYAVAAAKPGTAVRTNESLGYMNRPVAGPLGSPEMKAGFAKDEVAAMSEARIFFERPVRSSLDITGASLFRADGHKEYASLYNPYWQVRLSTPSPLTRAAVYGLGGINPALSAFAQ
jgi:hypothetical protein